MTRPGSLIVSEAIVAATASVSTLTNLMLPMPDPSALRLRIFLPVMSIVLPGVMNPSVRPVAESVTSPMYAPPESSTLPEKDGQYRFQFLAEASRGVDVHIRFVLGAVHHAVRPDERAGQGRCVESVEPVLTVLPWQTDSMIFLSYRVMTPMTVSRL